MQFYAFRLRSKPHYVPWDFCVSMYGIALAAKAIKKENLKQVITPHCNNNLKRIRYNKRRVEYYKLKARWNETPLH